MTQPGVSQHIKKLEEYYETALISRHGKQFELTPSGEQVYRFAHNLLAHERDLREQLKRDDPLSGVCRLSSPGALGLRIYPQLMQIQQQHSGLNIHFEVAPNHRIEAELLNNHIDFGLMTRLPETSSLSAQPVSKERLCLVVPKAFVFNEYSDLQRLGLINHPDASHHTTLLLKANFPRQFNGVSDFPVKGSINQINLILEPVAAGLGFTVLPSSAITCFGNKQSVRTISLEHRVHETIYRTVKKHRPLPTRYDFLINELFPDNEALKAKPLWRR